MKEIADIVETIITPSYLVGGSVRDTLLGKPPKDYDFATPLLPDEIENLVKSSGRRAFITGKRFGTIGFKCEKDFVEVTTFRAERYGKTRKPEVRYVTSITEDLSRRDFTINAIAMRHNKTIDPFNGQADIDAKLIRAVGNPTERFNEDPLRMLRAVRLVAQLGFSIEGKTHKSIVKNAHKILSVSKERWTQELDKLLLGEYCAEGLLALFTTDLVKFLLPEIRLQHNYDQNSDWHDLTLLEHTISTVSGVPFELELRWAAMLHDLGKPFVRTENNRGKSNYMFHDLVGGEIIYGIGKRLKWSNERILNIAELVKNHLSDSSPLRKADNASKKMKSGLKERIK